MKPKRRKSAHTERASLACNTQADSCPLLALPVEVLHLVLGVLCPVDLAKLLPTSKAMAQLVMQHSAGRLTLKVELHRRMKLAATRQVLQWAPTSSLKITLDGRLAGSMKADWGTLDQLFVVPCNVLPASNSHQGQHMQQFPCVTEVCIQNFTLPSLVPAGLAAMCPNMHTLFLDRCTIQGCGQPSSSKTGSSCGACSSSSSSSSMSVVWPAWRVHTLMLHATHVPACMTLPAANARTTRSIQQAVQHAEQHAQQLSNSLPVVTCLKLNCLGTEGVPMTREHLLPLGPQLQELQISQFWGMPDLQLGGTGRHLQQLQKLVLPYTDISSAADMQQLLSLPNLLHLEIQSVSKVFPQNFSSHSCKWQYLHLHLGCTTLHLCALAKLPLHSLTHPLKLGSKEEDYGPYGPYGPYVQVRLPHSSEDGTLDDLKRLAQRLTACGVQLVGDYIEWVGNRMITDDELQGTPDDLPWVAHQVAAFIVLAPALRLQTRIALSGIFVHPALMQAMANVYGSSLKQLDMDGCTFNKDTQPVWQAVLSGLPTLDSIQLIDCLFGEVDDWEDIMVLPKAVRKLATAMAQQPTGRCIRVAGRSTLLTIETSEDFAGFVLEGAEEGLAGVDIAPKDDKDYWDPCLHITSKHG